MRRSEYATSAAVWRDPRAIALLFAASLTTMANATISPALAGLEAEFSDVPNSAFLVRFLVSAPSLPIIFIASLAGIAVDRFGRCPVLMPGLLLFVFAGTAGLYLSDLYAIFASRLLLGISVAMIMTAQTALIGDYFTGPARTSLTGLQVSARNLGGFVFIALAGMLAAHSSRLPFAIYGLAAFLVPLAWMVIREPSRGRGEAVHSVAASSAVLKAEDTETEHWFAILIGLASLQGLTSMSFFLMPTQSPFFLLDRGFDSATMTGVVLGILTLCGGLAAIAYRRLQGLFGYARVLGSGYGLMALGFGLLTLQSGLWAIYLGAASIGVGFACVMPNFVAVALAIVPARYRGRAGGILTTTIFTGQVVSPLISIPLIETYGFEITFAATASLLGLFALGCLTWHLSVRGAGGLSSRL